MQPKYLAILTLPLKAKNKRIIREEHLSLQKGEMVELRFFYYLCLYFYFYRYIIIIIIIIYLIYTLLYSFALLIAGR